MTTVTSQLRTRPAPVPPGDPRARNAPRQGRGTTLRPAVAIGPSRRSDHRGHRSGPPGRPASSETAPLLPESGTVTQLSFDALFEEIDHELDTPAGREQHMRTYSARPLPPDRRSPTPISRTWGNRSPPKCWPWRTAWPPSRPRPTIGGGPVGAARRGAGRRRSSSPTWNIRRPQTLDPDDPEETDATRRAPTSAGPTRPNSRSGRRARPWEDWELMEFYAGRDPATGRPRLSDQEIETTGDPDGRTPTLWGTPEPSLSRLGDFRAGGQGDLAPAGKTAKARANLAALAVLRAIRDEQRPATPAEQAVLARWAGWGALPEVFDPARQDWAWARRRAGPPARRDGDGGGGPLDDQRPLHLGRGRHRHLVGGRPAGVHAAGGSWSRGSGPGTSWPYAPTALIRGRWSAWNWTRPPPRWPRACTPPPTSGPRASPTPASPTDHFDLAVGNVPFAKIVLHDRVHNPRRAQPPQPLPHQIAPPDPPGRARGDGDVALDDGRPQPRRPPRDRRAGRPARRRPPPRRGVRAAAGTDAVCDVLRPAPPTPRPTSRHRTALPRLRQPAAATRSTPAKPGADGDRRDRRRGHAWSATSTSPVTPT